MRIADCRLPIAEWGKGTVGVQTVAILSACLLLSLSAGAADFAPVVRWTNAVEDLKPVARELLRGETVVLEPRWTQGGAALDLTGATNVLLGYTDANPSTNSVYYSLTGTVHSATGGVVRFRWTAAACGAADWYNYEVIVADSSTVLCRSFGRLTLLPGVTDAGAAATNPPAAMTIDWSRVLNVASSPIATAAAVSSLQATADAISNVVRLTYESVTNNLWITNSVGVWLR